MANNPSTQFPGQILPPSAPYPFGQARDITTTGDGTGTPFTAAGLNDIYGFQQSVLSAAGLTPSGNPDQVGASQYLEGLNQLNTLSNANLAEALARTDIAAGMVIHVVRRTAGQFDGGSFWEVVTASTVTPNTHNIVLCTGIITLALQLQVGQITNPAHFGVVYDASFRNATDGMYYSDAGLTVPATNNQAAMQAAWDYAYMNNGRVRDSFGSALVNSVVFPPAGVTEPRGDAFTVRSAGAGNAFVQALPALATTYVNNRGTDMPVIDHQDRRGSVNTGGAFDISGIRIQVDSNTQPAIHMDQFGEYARLHRVEIIQFGDSDGMDIEYFLKGDINNMNILNGDAFAPPDGSITRTGSGVRIRAGDGGGIPTIKKVTSRGFDVGFTLGEGATSADNMSGLLMEQCECSIVRMGIDIRLFTLKPTLDTCYFEGIERVDIMDRGTMTDVRGCIHFINNTPDPMGRTYIDSNGSTYGNSYHENYLETNNNNDTLVLINASNPKSCYNNHFLYSGTTATGLTGVEVTGVNPNLDLNSNAFLPRGDWLGTNTIKIEHSYTGTWLGYSQAQNGSNLSCPIINGAVSLVRGAMTLTEANVTGNVLTLPAEVNLFDFAPTVPVSINQIVGANPNNITQRIEFDITNTNVTFTDSSFINLNNGTNYTGMGYIEFSLRRTGTNYFANERGRATYI